MSKFKQITEHLYTAENQNGFTNALYHYFNATDDGNNNTYSKKKVKEMVQNYPKTYPTSFVIVDKSFECGKVYIEEFDMDWEGHFLNSF